MLSDWIASLLFIGAATLVAPARKHYAAGGAFAVLGIAHTVMLIEATKHPISPQLFSTESLYVSALGGCFMSAAATLFIVRHYLKIQREKDMIVHARRFYREWADAPQQHPSRVSQAPVFARAKSAEDIPAPAPFSPSDAAAIAEPPPLYSAEVMTSDAQPQAEPVMTMDLSFVFADEKGRRKKLVVAENESVGFVKTAFLLGIISPGRALKYVFKPKKNPGPSLLKNPAWFKSRREIEVDVPIGRVASSESQGRNLLVDSLSEYRR